MKIHELEYLPVVNVAMLRRNEDTWTPPGECLGASLYGHWCHLRYADDVIVSIPASSVIRIEWARP